MVSLFVALAGCQSGAGGSPSTESAAPTSATPERDLTRPASEGRLSAVSSIELAPTAPRRTRVSATASVAPKVAPASALSSYVLEPAAAPLPKALSAYEVAPPRASVVPKPISVTHVASGVTIGASTQELAMHRPGRLSLEEPYEFAGLARAFEPDHGDGIPLRRGGSCGSARELWAAKLDMPRF